MAKERTGKEQARANEWWSDLHPYNRVFFTADKNPTDSQILKYYRQNERNKPTAVKPNTIERIE